MNALPIHWPAVIRYGDDRELGYVSSEHEWMVDASHHAYVTGRDYMVDSSGVIFDLAFDTVTREAIINETGRVIDLDSFERLLKGHLEVMNHCCISKLSVSSIAEAMALIESSQD
jgi:hypothetical protein